MGKFEPKTLGLIDGDMQCPQLFELFMAIILITLGDILQEPIPYKSPYIISTKTWKRNK